MYPKNVLNKVESHIKVKITVVCLDSLDFKLDYKHYVKITHIFSEAFTKNSNLKHGVKVRRCKNN